MSGKRTNLKKTVRSTRRILNRQTDVSHVGNSIHRLNWRRGPGKKFSGKTEE